MTDLFIWYAPQLLYIAAAGIAILCVIEAYRAVRKHKYNIRRFR